MSTNIKVIRWLILIAALAFMVVLCININTETGLIALNSIWVSNNMLLTLFGGICSGLAAVLAEKMYMYFLNKVTVKNYLYNNAMMLYSDFYYMHRDIVDLLCDRNLPVPENLFSNRIPTMYNRLFGIANTEYCIFYKKNKFMLVHNNFVQNEFLTLKKGLDKSIYLDIAYIKFRKSNLENSAVQEAKENIYKTIKVMDIFAESAMMILENYLEVLQKESSKKFNWSNSKKTIHNSYLGIYNSGNLDTFLKQNLKEYSEL